MDATTVAVSNKSYTFVIDKQNISGISDTRVQRKNLIKIRKKLFFCSLQKLFTTAINCGGRETAENVKSATQNGNFRSQIHKSKHINIFDVRKKGVISKIHGERRNQFNRHNPGYKHAHKSQITTPTIKIYCQNSHAHPKSPTN